MLTEKSERALSSGSGPSRTWPAGLLLAGLLALAQPGHAEERIVYCASDFGGPGNGTLAAPYGSLARINWSQIATWIADGDSVRIELRRGSIFRETLSVGTSGTADRPLVIAAYGEGANPQIRGDTGPLTGWTIAPEGAGRTWKTSVASRVSLVWVEGEFARFAGAPALLANGQWFWNAGQLYFRQDQGERVIEPITAAVLSSAVVVHERSHVTLEALEIQGAGVSGISLRNAENVAIRQCTVRDCGTLVTGDNVRDLAIHGCQLLRPLVGSGVRITGLASTVEILFCFFHEALYAASHVDVMSAAKVEILNCTFVGARRNHVFNRSSGHVQIANCIFSALGIAIDAQGSGAVESVSGNASVIHSCVQPNGQLPTARLSGIRFETNNISFDPQFQRTRRYGLFSLMQDDTAHALEWAALADLAEQQGFRLSFAVDGTHQLFEGVYAALQPRVLRGHDLSSHTRSHARLPMTEAFTIQYLGESIPCELSIQKGWLRTRIADRPEDGLEIDLSGREAASQEKLVSLMDQHPAYECRQVTGYNHRVPAILLTEVKIDDIKAQPSVIRYEPDKFYEHEVIKSKRDIEQRFRNADGSAYVCDTMVYPGGYTDEAVIGRCLEAGYYGGRTTTSIGNWQLRDIDLFQLNAAPASADGLVAALGFEGSTIDRSSAQNHFRAVRARFSQEVKFDRQSAVYLDGANTYLYRTQSADFEFGTGDWHFSTHLFPERLSDRATLFFCGTQESFVQAALESDGSVALLARDNGADALSARTRPGLLVTNRWQKVSVQQTGSRWVIRVNDETKLEFRSSHRLRSSGGTVAIGARAGVGDNDGREFFGGYLDEFIISNGTVSRIHGVLSLLAEMGGYFCEYGHGNSGMPVGARIN